MTATASAKHMRARLTDRAHRAKQSRMRRAGKGVALGAAVGLALFALEGLSIRAGAHGLNFDTEGPFAAVVAAIKPALPGLLARIALTCAIGGAVLGAIAVALASLWNPR